MILTGQLRAGDRLPPTRALSIQLGVSRITMTLAYDRLTLEGYIDAIKSVGTFVSRQIPENALHSVQLPHKRHPNRIAKNHMHHPTSKVCGRKPSSIRTHSD